MLSKISSAAISGIDANIIEVETNVETGFPDFELVGLVSVSIKEARERVQVAIRNSGISLKPMRITINLSPADIKKNGTGFDLPIALSLLSAYQLIGITPYSQNFLKTTLFTGELSLSGKINRINGILPIACAALEGGFKNIVVPMENLREASCVSGLTVYGAETLNGLIAYFNSKESSTGNEEIDNNLLEQKYGIKRATPEEYCADGEISILHDFSEVAGQSAVKRAAEVAAAGMHNILLSGAPGSGKTMIARCIPYILPPLSFKESLEVSKIYSVCGEFPDNSSLITKRPFRNPHHTITATALTGGGTNPIPGEVSLADKGILFLDEFPEFSKQSIETLRVPLEERHVCINRLNGSFTFPADFMLVAAMNPCPCGNYPDRNLCKCSDHEIMRYQNKISRPILDRIDIYIRVSNPQFSELTDKDKKGRETTAQIRKRVIAARKIQLERFKNDGITCNSAMTVSMLDKYCPLGKTEQEIVKTAFESLKLTARSYHRLIKVSRTIADLDASENIKAEHIYEAISYHSTIDGNK